MTTNDERWIRGAAHLTAIQSAIGSIVGEAPTSWRDYRERMREYANSESPPGGDSIPHGLSQQMAVDSMESQFAGYKDELAYLPLQPLRAYFIIRSLDDVMRDVLAIVQTRVGRYLSSCNPEEVTSNLGAPFSHSESTGRLPGPFPPGILDVPDVTVVGTLQRGQVNATVIGMDDPNVAIIAFEFGVVKFVSHVGAILARIMSRPEIQEKLEPIPKPIVCYHTLC